MTRLALVICVMLWLRASTTAQEPFPLGLDPKKALTQYNLDTWQRDDGLPSSSILSIIQTSDGYLWFGTYDGLARFDGEAFTVFTKSNTDAIKNSGIWTLYESRNDKSLWVGTNGGGLTRYKNSVWTNYSTADGLSSDIVRAIAEDREGALWLATPRGIDCFKDGTVIAHYGEKEGIPLSAAVTIFVDSANTVWAGTTSGIRRLVGNEFVLENGSPKSQVRVIYQDRKNTVWFGTVGDGLFQWRDGRLVEFERQNELPDKRITTFCDDRFGTLWIGTFGSGIARILPNQPITTFSNNNGLSDNQIQATFSDGEGSLWIGAYRGGLYRLRDGKFLTYTTQEGLIGDIVYSVHEDKSGAIWLATFNGVSRFKDNQFSSLTTKDGLADNAVRTLAGSEQDTLWIASFKGLCAMTKGKIKTYTTKDGMPDDRTRTLFREPDGTLWIGTQRGLARYRNGVITAFSEKDGIAKHSIISIRKTSDNYVWICTDGGGLYRYRDGKFTVFTTKEGLPTDVIFSVYEDREKTLWIGSNAGLVRLKNGVFKNLTMRQGLFSETAFHILEDNQSNFWIGSGNGIYSVNRNDLNELADDKREKVTSTSFGQADGMKTSETLAPAAPCKAADGRFWIPTPKGVVVINPDGIPRNTRIPPVKIEQILTEQGSADLTQSPQFEAGTQRFGFYYTALSYIAPEKVKFRVKLDGFDNDWIDIGTKRETYYTNLQPGNYEFHVIACNNDGIWNNDGASIRFELKPYFYQTIPFYVVAALSLTLSGVGIYSVRVRGIERRKKELENLVEERTKELQTEKLKAEQALAQAEFQRRVAHEMSDALAISLFEVEHQRDEIERQRREAENQRKLADDANAKKTEFLGIAAHDLKNPLQSIMGFAALIEEAPDEKSQITEMSRIIQSASRRMLRLVTDLLETAAFEAESFELNRYESDLVGLTKLVIDQIRPLAAKKNQTIEFASEQVCIAEIDEERIRDTFENLIGNAVKYSPPDKRIYVNLDKRKTNNETTIVRFTVRDEGQGLTDEDKQKLFGRFQRLSARPTGNESSTGLGLFIVKQVIELHGGRVWAESDGKDKGSTFIVELPEKATELNSNNQGSSNGKKTEHSSTL